MFNILAAQASDDYDTVEIKFTVNKHNYTFNVSVELLSDSFVNIYKHNSFGNVTKILNNKTIESYKYNLNNMLIGSSNCVISYDENGKPEIVVLSNGIKQEFTRDLYGNITNKKKGSLIFQTSFFY